MDVLFDLNPVFFAMAKAALVGGGCYLLWTKRQHSWAVVSIFIAFVAYYGVAIQHVEGATWATLHLIETMVA
jgi:hypothetical protein